MRILIFKYTLTALLVLLLGGLFYTQIIKGGYYADLGENNRIRLQPIKAPRGHILDRNGVNLAENRPSYSVSVVPRDFNKKYSKTLEELLGLKTGSLDKKVSSKRINPYMPIVIADDITREDLFRIQEMKPDLTGVSISVGGRRRYPEGDRAGHLTGYIGKVSREEYKSGHGKYAYNDYIGRAGIEKQFDDFLRGEDGGRQVEVNSRGEVIRVLGERKPKPGEDVVLSIDSELQNVVWDVVKDYDFNIAVGIVDLKTNEMIVMVSNPTYDPNVFVTGGKSDERMMILRDKRHPMMSRLISAGYPPGSIFKLITGVGGLETGKITKFSTFHCDGTFQLGVDSHVFHCWNPYGHGDINLHWALAESCNVYFYKLGKKLGEAVIAKTARIFGLSEEPGVELPGVFSGLVPTDAWKKKRFGDRWYTGDTISYAIGQGYLLLSPLQVLRMVAAFGKEGELPELTVLKDKETRVRRLPIKSEDIETITRAMRDVVQSDRGTGKHARVGFTEIAAKTGTAQNPRGEPHAWFAGFFPYDNPRYALVCILENGGAGGQVAGAFAREILTAWQEKKGIELV